MLATDVPVQPPDDQTFVESRDDDLSSQMSLSQPSKEVSAMTQNTVTSAAFRQLCFVLAALSSNLVFAAGDVTVKTSHPQYPGEGAFQTVEDCVAFATQGTSKPQDSAIALYKWLLTHQWHLMSPMEWQVPGRIPDSADPGDYETVLFDANRARFSYGYGLCGTVHAWNEVYWKALGMQARRREFPNHINSEVFYNNRWHAFDTDMAGLLFRPDGEVAGYEDIIQNPELADAGNPPLPHYPFAWPSDFDTMKAGWQQVAQKKKWYSMYNGGYAAHPAIASLRSGETFTRWYDRDHFGGPTKRRFWQNQEGGPHRNWTYFNNGNPFHDGAEANARSEATYCNGEFVYEPPLHSRKSREGMSACSDQVAHRQQSPSLYSTDGSAVAVTFQHFSPYVICGDPVDDANPMSATATDGVVVEGEVVGTVTCEVSNDQGQSWHAVVLLQPMDNPGRSAGTFKADLTEHTKGRYGWHIRFGWSGTAGLNALRFRTTTQVCQAIYPRLTPNGCDVTCRSSSRSVVPVLPNFGLSEKDISAVEVTELRSENLKYTPRSPTQRYAYEAMDTEPAHVVFRVAAPTVLTEVRAAFRYQLNVSRPQDCRYDIDLSTDGGITWTTFATSEIPSDNEFSSGWLSGRTSMAAEFREALVRFRMNTPGRKSAMIDAQLYGIHHNAVSGPVTMEFGWLEKGKLQTQQTILPASQKSNTMHIPTGRELQDSFVRLMVKP